MSTSRIVAALNGGGAAELLRAPGRFDALMFGEEGDRARVELLLLDEDNGLVAYRKALVHLYWGRPARAVPLLAAAREAGLPTVGAERWVGAILSDESGPGSVVPRGSPSGSLDPLDVEDQFHHELADAILARKRPGASLMGHGHAARAVLLGEVLGLTGRLDIARHEQKQHAERFAGVALTVHASAPLPFPRERVDDLVRNGSYREAVTMLQAHRGPPDLMATYQVALGQEDRVAWTDVPDSPLGRLARSALALIEGRLEDVHLPDRVHELDESQTTFMHYLAARSAIQRGESATVARLVGSDPPDRPDRRFFWALVHFVVLAQSGEGYVSRPFTLPDVAFEALRSLHRNEDVLTVARRLWPTGLLLLSRAMGAPPPVVLAAGHVPLLLGDRMKHDHGVVRVNRQMGEALVRDAFAGDHLLAPSVTRRSRHLFRQRLAELGVKAGMIVPIPRLYDGATVLARRAAAANLPQHALHWRGVREALLAESALLRTLVMERTS